jgi:transposase
MFKRNKYNYAFRLKCVEAVIERKLSVKKVANEYGIESSNLRLWLGFYEKYGKEGLTPRIRQQYEPIFKEQVLKTIDREFLSLRAACVRFNIPSESVILSWRKAYELIGPKGLISQRKGRPPKMKQPIKSKPKKSTKALTREEELLKENEYLRAENALLKKLQALVQADKKQKP